MKRTHILLCQRLLLLLILSLATYGGPQPVEADAGNQGDPDSPLRLIWASPPPPELFCVGKKITIDFKFQLWFGEGASKLIPSSVPVVKITPTFQKGEVVDLRPPKYPEIIQGLTYAGSFTYKAAQAGDEMVTVSVSVDIYSNEIEMPFHVSKCKGSLQFNQQKTYSYDVVSMTNNYFGSGTISANEDGQISGSGVQAIWSYISPYSADGGSCVHNSPWEGSSGITFSGQAGEAGDTSVTMELEALSINATTLTCAGGDSSGTMTFPAYTYSSCQVLLAGFNFEAATLDVPFNCPGMEPFTVPITIIPRRES